VVLVTGDGLVRPFGAPAGQQTSPGIQPGTNGILLARYVIVSGAGDGVFVYSGTPGPGNPPIAWTGSGLVDPYGNVLPATTGVSGSGVFQAGDTRITPAGIFVYSAAPAAGNLIASVTNGAGTDPYGNAYVAGSVSYGSLGALTALVGGRLVLNSAGTTSLSEIVGGNVVSFFSSVDSLRFDMPVQPLFALHPGTTATQESWQPLALVNGWAAGTGQPPSYQLVPSPENHLELRGSLNGSAATAAQFAAIPSSPAGYLPQHTSSVPASSTTLTRTGQVFVQLSTGGALSVAASVITDNFLFGGLIPLDT
jgi:hypothetical protein